MSDTMITKCACMYTYDRSTPSCMSQNAGPHAASFTPVKSRNYEAGVKLVKSVGFTGQYFEKLWFFHAPLSQPVQVNMHASHVQIHTCTSTHSVRVYLFVPPRLNLCVCVSHCGVVMLMLFRSLVLLTFRFFKHIRPRTPPPSCYPPSQNLDI